MLKLLLVRKPQCLEKYCSWRTRRDLQKKRFTDDMQFHVSFRKIAPLGHLLVCHRLSGTSCPVSKELVQTLASRGPGYDGKDARCEERNLDKWKHERILCDGRRDLAWQLLAQENVQWLVVKQIQVSSIIDVFGVLFSESFTLSMFFASSGVGKNDKYCCSLRTPVTGGLI